MPRETRARSLFLAGMDQSVPLQLFDKYNLWKLQIMKIDSAVTNGNQIADQRPEGNLANFHQHKILDLNNKYESVWDDFVESMVLAGANIDIITVEHQRVQDDLQRVAIRLQPKKPQTQIAPNPQTSPVKLPPVTVPTFDSTQENWQGFWTLFESLVHTRVDLDSSIKFTYLKNAFKCQSLKLVQGFEITPDRN